MCFSPEASFSAAAVVTTFGVISFRKSNDNPAKIFSLIPIFFGIQQFCEGWVWLSLLHEKFEAINHISSMGFILFAWVVWPFYVPFTHARLETNPTRKKLIKWLTYFGLGVSLVLLYTMIFRNVHSKILDCSIIYDFDVIQSWNVFFGILYLIVTVAPTLISSIPKVWLLGLMNAIAYFITKVYISDRILSVWCFFAAISSMLVLWIIMERKRKMEKI